MSLTGRVLVTGGTGFLGRGIMRKAKREGWNCEFTVLSRDEYKQDTCRRKYKDARYVLGNVQDIERLTLTMLGHDIVIHAAALKYIPEAELNVDECIGINVYGSMNVIQAARAAEVPTVVGISTDKACMPVNVYGTTKFLMERLFAEAAQHDTGNKFMCCRYGNVVGSTGSVIPLFERQLADQGYINVTDTTMTRYFISVDEAVQLIEHAVDEPLNGAVIIPEPKAMAIGDLAHVMANGLPISIIGRRYGEKKHEDMLSVAESLRTQGVDHYYRMFPTGWAIEGTLEGVNEYSPINFSSDKAERIDPKVMLSMIKDAENV